MRTLSTITDQKPPPGTRLDPSHPSASGLLWALPFNEGGGAFARNHGSKQGGLAVSGNLPGAYFRGNGVYFDGAATSYLELQDRLGGSEMGLTGSITVMIRFMYTGNANTLRCLIGDNTSAGNERQVSLYLEGNAGVKKVTFWQGDGLGPTDKLVQGLQVVDSDTAPRWWTVVATRFGASGATNWTGQLYLNGRDDGTGSTTAKIPTASQTDRSRLGRGGSFSTAPYLGFMDYAFIWNRWMESGEAKALTANPWQMFEVPSCRRWFIPQPSTAPPGAFNPGWATRATTIIGAGTV